MGKRLTIEIKKKIFQCFQQGMRTRSVARQLNLRCSTVEQLETKYCGGDISWINSSYTKVDPEKLLKAVLEYLNSPDGYFRLAKKYGPSSSGGKIISTVTDSVLDDIKEWQNMCTIQWYFSMQFKSKCEAKLASTQW